MGLTKIEDADIIGKQVSELPDIPEMTAAELKQRFDAMSEDVLIPKFNKLVSELEDESAAESLGIKVPDGITADGKISSVIAALSKIALATSKVKHSHENGSVLDLITSTVKNGYDRLVTLFEKVTSVSDAVTDDSGLIPTGKAIVAYVKKLGAGDMVKVTYDANDDGVVDDSEKLGGKPPEYYATSDSVCDMFSETVNYSVGDYCIKDNVLYKFTTEKAAGEWDDSKVIGTKAAEEFKMLNSKLIPTVVSGVVMTNYDGITISPYRHGNLVYCFIYVNGNIGLTANSDAHIASLTKLKPKHSVQGLMRHAGGDTMCSILITTEGEVYVRPGSAGAYYGVSLTWITDDY